MNKVQTCIPTLGMIFNIYSDQTQTIPITITLLAQSWTGVPRVIRLNTTQFAVFKTGDKNQLKQIYDTFTNTVEFDKFELMYKEAVSKPHSFLFIDTVPKKRIQEIS